MLNLWSKIVLVVSMLVLNIASTGKSQKVSPGHSRDVVIEVTSTSSLGKESEDIEDNLASESLHRSFRLPDFKKAKAQIRQLTHGSRVEFKDENALEEAERESEIPGLTALPSGLNFSCRDRVPGYYTDPDPLSKCQVYHMCMVDGRKYSLLCGIGTVFNQRTFVCDHWYSYNCQEASSDHSINSKIWNAFLESQEYSSSVSIS